MTASLRRAPRWSKKTDELVRHVAVDCRPGLQSELGEWLEESSRFRTFVTANQDKVRKKLSATDEQSRLDVRAELLVARSILSDRRFEVAFESYGARRAGPDLTVTYRTNQRFNLEVTRLRTTGDAADETAGAEPGSGAWSPITAGGSLASRWCAAKPRSISATTRPPTWPWKSMSPIAR